MTPEYFKGDATEKKFYAATNGVFTDFDIGLNEFYLSGYDASPFLLMLYDEARIPFSERINKNAFVEFIKETLKRFPFIGSFDTYLFIVRAIFGQLSTINFQVLTPGILSMDINATSSLEFEFISRDEFGNLDTMISSNAETLMFRGISGIETQYELELLFSEIMPAGIIPAITLTFFTRYDFVALEGGILSNVVDHLGNQIIFNEIG